MIHTLEQISALWVANTEKMSFTMYISSKFTPFYNENMFFLGYTRRAI